MLRRMFAEPGQPSFDGRWLEFGRHHACRHGGVVNLNYGRQISLNSITDDHFVQGTVHTATKLDSAAPYSTFTAYVSSSGSALRRGTSLAYASNRSGGSPLGDRKSVVEGKRVGVGGGGRVEKIVSRVGW